MFEDMTYEYLIKRALANVPTDVDKRQGSIIYDALAPACAELAQMYIQAEMILQNAFASTAIREYLVLIAKERGLEPYGASGAILRLKATYNGNTENISIGDRFNLDKLNYIVTEQMTNDSNEEMTVKVFKDSESKVKPNEYIPGMWKVECETAGTEGNRHLGRAVPINTIDELATAEITELLIPGEDMESTEDFRQRYFDSINNESFGGNRADYVRWVKEMDGVGQVKAKRTPYGGGTVGVIITDSEGKPATEELIKSVKEALDPEKNTAEGEGVAPIGHNVTVSTVETQYVNISFTNIEYESYVEDIKAIKDAMKAKLDEYAEEINADWEDRTTTKIYAAQVLARCLDTEGILNIESAELNGESYIILDENKIVSFESSF